MAANKSPFLEPFLKQSPTVSEFVYQLIQEQFDRIVRKERGVLADEDPEYLHQMRVGCRRLSAALQTFAGAIEISKKAHGKRIGTLAQTLGKQRDLDVQMAAISKRYYPTLDIREQQKLDKLLAVMKKKRSRACAAIRILFQQPSYQELKDAYQDWLNQPQYKPKADRPLSLLLPELLSPLLCALLIHPAWWTLAEEQGSGRILHDLRKTCKAVRYQFEFFTPFYGWEFQAWIDSLKKLQDTLGEIQDHQVLRNLLSAEFGKNLDLPGLEQIICHELQENMATWDALKCEYLNLDFRHHLHQIILKPGCLNFQAESTE